MAVRPKCEHVFPSCDNSQSRIVFVRRSRCGMLSHCECFSFVRHCRTKLLLRVRRRNESFAIVCAIVKMRTRHLAHQFIRPTRRYPLLKNSSRICLHMSCAAAICGGSKCLHNLRPTYCSFLGKLSANSAVAMMKCCIFDVSQSPTCDSTCVHVRSLHVAECSHGTHCSDFADFVCRICGQSGTNVNCQWITQGISMILIRAISPQLTGTPKRFTGVKATHVSAYAICELHMRHICGICHMRPN